MYNRLVWLHFFQLQIQTNVCSKTILYILCLSNSAWLVFRTNWNIMIIHSEIRPPLKATQLPIQSSTLFWSESQWSIAKSVYWTGLVEHMGTEGICPHLILSYTYFDHMRIKGVAGRLGPPIRLVPNWFENVPPDLQCMSVELKKIFADSVNVLVWA